MYLFEGSVSVSRYVRVLLSVFVYVMYCNVLSLHWYLSILCFCSVSIYSAIQTPTLPISIPKHPAKTSVNNFPEEISKSAGFHCSFGVLKLSHLGQLLKERVDIKSIQSESRLVAKYEKPLEALWRKVTKKPFWSRPSPRKVVFQVKKRGRCLQIKTNNFQHTFNFSALESTWQWCTFMARHVYKSHFCSFAIEF